MMFTRRQSLVQSRLHFLIPVDDISTPLPPNCRASVRRRCRPRDSDLAPFRPYRPRNADSLGGGACHAAGCGSPGHASRPYERTHSWIRPPSPPLGTVARVSLAPPYCVLTRLGTAATAHSLVRFLDKEPIFLGQKVLVSDRLRQPRLERTADS